MSLLPVREASIATRLPQTMLRRMADNGEIPFVKQGRKRLFDPQQVLAAVFAEANRRTDADRIDGIVQRAVARRRGLPPLDQDAVDFMKQGIRQSPREIADLELAAEVLGV
ncbi:MAG: helix-turn-helix domain-containing protein [Phycisphaerales bacterium]|nr:helix-turn-helix domain-containing protein [Phycisphaerales bacterium]